MTVPTVRVTEVKFEVEYGGFLICHNELSERVPEDCPFDASFAWNQGGTGWDITVRIDRGEDAMSVIASIVAYIQGVADEELQKKHKCTGA